MVAEQPANPAALALPGRSRRPLRHLGAAVRWALVLFFSALFLYPFAWLLAASLKPRGQVFDNRLIPKTFSRRTTARARFFGQLDAQLDLHRPGLGRSGDGIEFWWRSASPTSVFRDGSAVLGPAGDDDASRCGDAGTQLPHLEEPRLARYECSPVGRFVVRIRVLHLLDAPVLHDSSAATSSKPPEWMAARLSVCSGGSPSPLLALSERDHRVHVRVPGGLEQFHRCAHLSQLGRSHELHGAAGNISRHDHVLPDRRMGTATISTSWWRPCW